MYFNDVHVLVYVLWGIMGLIVGNILPQINTRLENHEKVIYKDFLKDYIKKFRPHYILMFTMFFIYIALLYTNGLNPTFIQNLDLIKYMILIPFLLSIAIIDYKKNIIPNRLLLTMFEIGIVLTFIYGISNINSSMDMLLGALLGAGIFGILTFLGRMVSGDEAMGMGDVKMFAVLGLYLGSSNILLVSIISFIIASIYAIIMIIAKKKKLKDYLPFGPFVLISCLMIIFVPFNIILSFLLKIFTLGMYSVK